MASQPPRSRKAHPVVQENVVTKKQKPNPKQNKNNKRRRKGQKPLIVPVNS